MVVLGFHPSLRRARKYAAPGIVRMHPLDRLHADPDSIHHPFPRIMFVRNSAFPFRKLF
jgi:hypothetical protein